VRAIVLPALGKEKNGGRGRVPFALALGLALSVAACAGLGVGGANPVPVDARAAAASTSAYRATQGRGPVGVSSRLNALAARQAMAMARRGRLGHDLIGPLQKRLKNGGYVWLVAVENISAGYDTFDEALAAWQTSSGHRSNLLEPQATEIGVAAARADDKYGTYWALILAAPDPEPRG
jgi:uncharacterized protein YkwD